MDRFQHDPRIGFEMFAEFSNENIHAAQEIIVFSPYVQQNFFLFPIPLFS